uniref:tRNA (34-2'-O)-methyltransferase regulator WDR6 n=1 Tax=Sphenodon punctatus TaxID=8508 RepID=A0A8D0L367_SPHPU
MTDAGAIYTYELATNAWALILEDASYQSYSLLAAARLGEGSVLCATGNLQGCVKVFPLSCPSQGKELRLEEGKIHSLTWALRPNQEPHTKSLFASSQAGILHWLEVSCSPPGGVTEVSVERRYLLPLCKQRWHTSVAFLPQGGLLVCGDRRGSLLLLACSLAPGSNTKEKREAESDAALAVPALPCKGAEPGLDGEPRLEGPTSLLFGLHGKLGVTSVTCHGDFIYSTGRDGCYRQLQVQGQQLQVLWKQRPCKGLEWLEQVRFAPDGSLWGLGFQASDFVLWSPSSSEALLRVPCGGGHRSWSYSRCFSSEAFAYIKSGDVLVYRRGAAPPRQRVLKESLHGRELTCVCHVGTVTTAGHGAVSVLVTGSEDTKVNVLAFGEQSRSVTQLAAISDHISSVRALAVTSPVQQGADGLSATLFSAGGRAQLECYQLLLRSDCSASGGVACQLIHVASHRLDEHWDCKKNRHKLIKMDPETRYMAVVVVAGANAPSLFLAAACSDGSVRLFQLLEPAQRLLLVAESFHHRRCVLKVQTFTHQLPGGARRHFLCSAATDGSIAFWDLSATLDRAAAAVEAGSREMQPLALGAPATIQAHSCGVNSLRVQKTAAGRYLVASGSDDGSIHICAVSVEPGSAAPPGGSAGAGIRVLRQLSRQRAHAAHVTGLWFLRPDLLLSASVDQRLTLWRLQEGGLAFQGSRLCPVADVAALECWEAGEQSCHCVVCGQGLEILRCPA